MDTDMTADVRAQPTARPDPDLPGVPAPITADEQARAGELVGRMRRAFEAKVVGQERLAASLLVTTLAEGHILLESVPGLAKTTAAATLAGVVSASFARIQCTPDLLPSDIVGTEVFDPALGEFETRLGPIHANFVLLDEINRASAKTQSATLEAMQERQTSIGGVVHPLPRPFMVLATQNPVEEEGTYPLPQAQTDRFLVKEVIGYPSAADELEILNRVDSGVLGTRASDPEPVIGVEDLRWLIDLTQRVYVDESVKRYAIAVVRATRVGAGVLDPEVESYVELGASPRGSIALQQASRALALLQGRSFVVPDDLRELRHPVLRHRVRLGFQALADAISVESVIDAVVAVVPTP
jgi:MoxR-like ATPase